MSSENKSRREFLLSSGSVLGSSIVGFNLPLVLLACKKAQNNIQARAGYENISPEQATELGAIADQIIPEDETPGATQIGVVYFMDAALAGWMAGARPVLEQGLEHLRQKVRVIDAMLVRFSDLSFEQQTELLKAEEDTPFFQTIHFLTLCGMFCLPRYGGNQDNKGWELLGFNHQHAWQPPFGFYDATFHNSIDNNGEKYGSN